MTLFRRVGVAGEECRLAYGGFGFGFNGVRILHMSCAHRSTGGEPAGIFGNNIAVRLDGNGVLIIESLARCDFLRREIRCVSLDGGLAYFDGGGVFDGSAVHHAIAAGEGRADAVGNLAAGLIFSVGFIFRSNQCVSISGDGGCAYVNRNRRSDVRLRFPTSPADATGTNGIDLYIHSVLVIRNQI